MVWRAPATGPPHAPDEERTSAAGSAAEDRQPGSTDQPRLPISRGDSAQMLWGAPEEARRSRGQDKPQRMSDVRLKDESAVPGLRSTGSSSIHHEGEEAAEDDPYAGEHVRSGAAHACVRLCSAHLNTSEHSWHLLRVDDMP